jgi:hypothetical protein
MEDKQNFRLLVEILLMNVLRGSCVWLPCSMRLAYILHQHTYITNLRIDGKFKVMLIRFLTSPSVFEISSVRLPTHPVVLRVQGRWQRMEEWNGAIGRFFLLPAVFSGLARSD